MLALNLKPRYELYSTLVGYLGDYIGKYVKSLRGIEGV